MVNLVWYASYGSNLYKDRFLCYIRGGRPEGAAKTFTGCTDRSPPIKNKPIIIPHELYFAKSSDIWQGGGVAFIKSNRDDNVRTLGRMYLITDEQFVQVVRQENALEVEDSAIQLDFEEIIRTGQAVIKGNWYSRVSFLGDDEGYPIFTFTSSEADDEIVPNAPSEKYLKTIIKGIKETYELTDAGIVEYLVDVEGIKGRIEEEVLIQWISEVEK